MEIHINENTFVDLIAGLDWEEEKELYVYVQRDMNDVNLFVHKDEDSDYIVRVSHTLSTSEREVEEVSDEDFEEALKSLNAKLEFEEEDLKEFDTVDELMEYLNDDDLSVYVVDDEDDEDELITYITDEEEDVEDLVEDDKDYKRAVAEDYRNHVPVTIILGRYGISAGKMYTILRNQGIQPQHRKSKVEGRIAEMSPGKRRKIVRDYEKGLTLKHIYDSHKINKNTLYTLLDFEGVERRHQ